MRHPFTTLLAVWSATLTLPASLLRPLLAVFRSVNNRDSLPTAKNSKPACGSVGLALMAATIFSAPATAATVDAVEYYHAGFGHYFMTGDAAEAAAIDAGKVSGWVRTGQTFKVHSTQEAGDSTVCRFFSTTFAPKSSHFYTPAVAECDLVKTNPNWLYEGTAFYLQTPSASGACPAGAKMVYRLYNNGSGGAPNHRYTASIAIRNQMIGSGWIPEGVGDGVSFCAGDAALIPGPNEVLISGRAAKGKILNAGLRATQIINGQLSGTQKDVVLGSAGDFAVVMPKGVLLLQVIPQANSTTQDEATGLAVVLPPEFKLRAAADLTDSTTSNVSF
ncbi:MAG: hypothetical protein HY777_07185 [Betaproteobacteria bacterium]|nr:hypothetical protein [Betaproteobacteria bacterium]